MRLEKISFRNPKRSSSRRYGVYLILYALRQYILTFFIITFAAVADADERAFTFGVVPQQSAGELARVWAPVLAYLSHETGYVLKFKTAKDIPTFEQRLGNSEYDFIYANPYHYVIFHTSNNYTVFAKEKNRKLRGIIVVQADSGYHNVWQLNGQVVAFPGPAAFAATLLPRKYLETKGVRVSPRYVASHDSVYQAVAQGFYPAGGGVERTFENLNPVMRDQLRILWRTPAFTSHAIAAHPRVPAAIVARLKTAMLHMADNPQGQAILKAINFTGIVTARDSEYDDIRALGLTVPMNETPDHHP